MINEIINEETIEHLQKLVKSKLIAFVPHKEVTIDKNFEEWQLYNAVVGTTLDKDIYDKMTKDVSTLTWLVAHLPGGKKLIEETTSVDKEDDKPTIVIPEASSLVKVTSKKAIFDTFELPEDVKPDDQEDYNVGYVDGKVELLDILYENTEGNLITSNDVIDPSEGYVPIAICLCKPGELGDGEAARYICLKYMNENDPEHGSVDANPKTSVWCKNKDGKLVTEMSFKYDDDKGINEAENDYAGLDHTIKILQAWGDDTYKTWSPSDESANPDKYANATIYPPVSLCWQYHTIATIQGQWYFPSYGELKLYYNHMYDTTNEDGTTTLGLASRMSQLQKSYPNAGVVYFRNVNMYSSSEENASKVIYPFFFYNRIVSGETEKWQNSYRIPAMIQVYDNNGYPKLTK